VDDAVAFLEGRETELVERLRGRMREASAGLRFEEAARVRDQLQAVERSLEKQRVLMGDEADRDVFGLYREGPDLCLQALVMRAGKLQDSRAYPFAGSEFPDADLLSSFLAMYYEREVPPEEVLLPLEPEGAGALAEVLSERRGRRVRLLTPQRGAKADLLAVAARNAEQGFRSWHERTERRGEAIAALMRALHLAREPRWIECYDISTFQGALAVGSGVSMRDGEPDRAGYRRYKVKGRPERGGSADPRAEAKPRPPETQDDFAMIHEVLSRRLRRALAEGSFPHLVVIDGGKGQLGAALAAAKDVGVATRPAPGNPGVPFVEMVGLAKSRLLEPGERRASRRKPARSERGDGGGRPLRPPPVDAARLADAAEAAEKGFVAEAPRSPERVFLPGRKDPVVLRQNSAELFLLTRVRDEAHRFAIAFHRKLRRGRNLQSVLEEIPGVGAGRRRALLRTLGSLRRIREASVEEIAAVEGFGPRQARAVHDFFRGPGAPAGDPEGALSEAEIDRALAEEDPGEPPGHPL
jgi:excinuclease ABC subunit C